MGPRRGWWPEAVPNCALASRHCQASPGSWAPISNFRQTPALGEDAVGMASGPVPREGRADFTPGPALALGPFSRPLLCHPSPPSSPLSTFTVLLT